MSRPTRPPPGSLQRRRSEPFGGTQASAAAPAQVGTAETIAARQLASLDSGEFVVSPWTQTTIATLPPATVASAPSSLSTATVGNRRCAAINSAPASLALVNSLKSTVASSPRSTLTRGGRHPRLRQAQPPPHSGWLLCSQGPSESILAASSLSLTRRSRLIP